MPLPLWPAFLIELRPVKRGGVCREVWVGPCAAIREELVEVWQLSVGSLDCRLACWVFELRERLERGLSQGLASFRKAGRVRIVCVVRNRLRDGILRLGLDLGQGVPMGFLYAAASGDGSDAGERETLEVHCVC